MNPRPLLIGPNERARAQEILSYATAHPYYPGDSVAPGNDPHYVMRVEVGFRVVFSVTVFEGAKHRHLSVSIDGHTHKAPHPEAVRAIALLFGFVETTPISRAGFSTSWILIANQQEGCITVIQKLPEVLRD